MKGEKRTVEEIRGEEATEVEMRKEMVVRKSSEGKGGKEREMEEG